jgi:predicted Rossmann fold nucleotide-binding protein DprA/Smf involved in DNA uptake
MRLIIAGGRNLRVNGAFIESALINFGLRDSVTEIISGGAEGIDWAGEEFSLEFLDKEATVLPADWMHLGAGHERNKKMAEYGEALLIIWDGKTAGSANMKTEIMRLKKPVYEIVMRSP